MLFTKESTWTWHFGSPAMFWCDFVPESADRSACSPRHRAELIIKCLVHRGWRGSLLTTCPSIPEDLIAQPWQGKGGIWKGRLVYLKVLALRREASDVKRSDTERRGASCDPVVAHSGQTKEEEIVSSKACSSVHRCPVQGQPGVSLHKVTTDKLLLPGQGWELPVRFPGRDTATWALLLL